MVGDGQEHVDRPIYDDDGEMIIWPTLDEEWRNLQKSQK